MRAKIVFLFLFRLLILLLSVATLACHVGQLILLGQVENTGQWWPDYIPYVLYYVGTIVSVMSATALLLIGCIGAKSLWSDRIVSVINLLLSIAIIVYNSLQSGTIPWTGAVTKPFESTMKGFVTYCSDYDDTLNSIRCWLTNGTWLGMVVAGFFWFLFALYATILRNSSVYNEDYDDYDFKEDVPMANVSQSPVLPQRPLQSTHQSMSHYSYQSNQPSYSYSQELEPSNYSAQPLRQQEEQHQQQQQEMYDYNYHQSPLQETQQSNSVLLNNSSQNGIPAEMNGAIAANDGFERSRKVSKTYIGDDGQEYSAEMSPMTPTSQPPHSYEVRSQTQ